MAAYLSLIIGNLKRDCVFYNSLFEEFFIFRLRAQIFFKFLVHPIMRIIT
jgi:hypothetical protein